MARARNPETRAVEALPRWVRLTIERDDSFRFEAIGLLDQARARLNALAASPPADGAAVAAAAATPLHLANKALLAARGYRSLSVRGTEELLGICYGKNLPEGAVDRMKSIIGMKLQGAGAIAAVGSHIESATRLL